MQFYTYLFRGTPLYIQLLICYTGIYSLAAVRLQPVLDAFFRDAMNCTILAFALNTCAYTTEIFAGAIRSMAHGEVEAAKAYGLSGWKLYAYVIMPSAQVLRAKARMVQFIASRKNASSTGCARTAAML